jgi:hypothetical protein
MILKVDSQITIPAPPGETEEGAVIALVDEQGSFIGYGTAVEQIGTSLIVRPDTSVQIKLQRIREAKG